MDFNVLVLGERGSGRTSLLRRLQRDPDEPVVYVDAQLLKHLEEHALVSARREGRRVVYSIAEAPA